LGAGQVETDWRVTTRRMRFAWRAGAPLRMTRAFLVITFVL